MVILFGVKSTSKSLSARRAWIEIVTLSRFGMLKQVALRKESVDRNVRPPAGPHVARKVALRKESVDRNRASEITGESRLGRSPQGERG